MLPESSATQTGFGTDVHFFTNNPANRLVLAGFPVAGHQGVEADSDGDVALHALFNAISSSIGGKSLGFYASRLLQDGITDSSRFIDLILSKVKENGYSLTHVALAFECVTPRIDPLIDAMKANLAKLLSLEPSHIGITATQGDRNTDRIRVSAVVSVVPSLSSRA